MDFVTALPRSTKGNDRGETSTQKCVVCEINEKARMC